MVSARVPPTVPVMVWKMWMKGYPVGEPRAPGMSVRTKRYVARRMKVKGKLSKKDQIMARGTITPASSISSAKWATESDPEGRDTINASNIA